MSEQLEKALDQIDSVEKKYRVELNELDLTQLKFKIDDNQLKGEIEEEEAKLEE